MKTINKNIDLFTNEKEALDSYNKRETPCQLLYSKGYWFIDTTKTAKIQWPRKYKLIAEK
jgi:hypothetical protein